MPLFDYFCGEHVHEALFLPREEVPEDIKCPVCGDVATKQLSMPASTPGRWGDQTGKFGVNGFYDRGLGARYQTSMQREKIMDAKGLVPESSFGKHHVEDTLQRQTAHQKQQDANIARYKNNVKKFEGDKGRAIAETFTVAEMKKNGTMAKDAAKEA
jgi:hypothetical protein|tara:strand:- start:1578 stop:2048 length:471 start_codon:yes stop_codon:yes gene_type:complete